MDAHDGLAQASDQAEAATRHEAVDAMARVGFVTRGVLFVTVAVLTASVAGTDGEQASATGAIDELAQHGFGTVVLVTLAVGLAGYAGLRLLHAVAGPDDAEGVQALLYRVAWVVQALAYGLLCAYAVRKLLGAAGGGGGGEQQATAEALQLPLGGWLVGAASAVIAGVALAQLARAVRRDVLEDCPLTGGRRRLVVWSGVVGHVARAALFGLVAWLLARAALQSDSSQAGGTDEAVRQLAATPGGTALLIVLALGLAAYGLWCLAVARWCQPHRP